MDEDRGARLRRLRWHCRRALLELDLMFERFWARAGEDIDAGSAAALERLLAMEDHELWELVSGRREPDDARLKDMVDRLRQV